MWPFKKRKAKPTHESNEPEPTPALPVERPSRPRRVVIEWPVADASGEVFDLEWLDLGTCKSMTPEQEKVIAAARASSDPGNVLFAEGVESVVRTEYNRRLSIQRFGRNFLHQPPKVLAVGDVRGIFYLEWGDHIDHMKRTGHLEEALALTYEVIDAAERVDALERGDYGAAGWYKHAAIILRKLDDVESEIRLIEDVQRRYPRIGQELSDRLPRARAILAKQKARQNG